MSQAKIKVAVVGGSGYTGVELVRLLLGHPRVELCAVTSRAEAGRSLADVFSCFRGYTPAENISFQEPEISVLATADLVFFATPNGTAMASAKALLAHDVKVIDLAADFRLRDSAQWQDWYGTIHEAPDLIEQAVYGLADLDQTRIAKASLVANPGCYPTSVQVPLRPLLADGFIDEQQPIIADCKSGVSGAGRSAKVAHSFAEISEDFCAYGVDRHRHWIEIHNGLAASATSGDLDFTFTPHLLPMSRGICSTIYTQLKVSGEVGMREARARLNETFQYHPFVTLLPEGEMPHTKSVRGSNNLHFNLFLAYSGRLVVVSVIDNLVKGAAGQAIQNMNIMFGRPMDEGLPTLGIMP